MAENKTQPTTVPVQEFIASIAHERRREDALLALAMYEDVTSLPGVMWGPSIIGFGVHEYDKAGGKKGQILAAGFSPRKANMTFYLGDSFDGAKELYEKLGKHKKSKACVYINKLDDVDMAVLREIVSRDFRHDRQGDC